MYKYTIKLPYISLLLLFAANLCYFLANPLGWVITLCVFLLLPGYLLLNRLKHKLTDYWIVFSLSLSLSLLLLMLSGLALNSLHTFGFAAPLSAGPIFITLDLMTLVLVVLNWRETVSIPQRLPQTSIEQILITIMLTLLPWFAVGGAMRLNNGASNTLTMVLFALIAILFVVLVWRKHLQGLYPYAIAMMGLSILLSVSLRGWLITGHDIQHEFYVFQMTNNAGYWNIAAYRDPYNACLSLTILPTIIAKITTIPAAYVYKVVFQVIFGFSLAAIYCFMKQLSNARVALMGAFLFISYPTFINDMPMLNRQEIAFLFFGVLMLVTFLELGRSTKTVLSLAFLGGLVISHYSSTYVTLGILALACLGVRFVFKSSQTVRESSNEKDNLITPLASMSIIVIAVLVTFLWNMQLTYTANGLRATIVAATTRLIDHSQVQASDVAYGLFPRVANDPQLLLNQQAKKLAGRAINVLYIPDANSALTPLGTFLSSKGINVTTLNSTIRAFSAKLLQILALIGIVLVFLSYRRQRTRKNAYLLALCLGCLTLLILQTLLPQLSVDYGTLRLYQQALIILSVPSIMALLVLLRPFGKWKVALAAVLLAFLFLHLSAFIPQITGGYPPQLSLNNSGLYYDAYYVQASEEASVKWLLRNASANSSAEMDSYGLLRFNPEQISKFRVYPPYEQVPGSYLYKDYMNVSQGTYLTSLSGDRYYYAASDGSRVSNQVYSNDKSAIDIIPKNMHN